MSKNYDELDQETVDALVKKFLEDGGKVTKCEKFARSEDIEYTVGWGKKRKKTPNSD